MSQVCSKCSRVNPADAAYCYYDGVILAGHSANGGPVNPGTAPFPSQFVFPSGLAVKNFDQFALACQNNWQSAVDLLKQGFLSSFLGGLGRADLALAAQEAARFPDQDRGLDQLLAKLPTHVLEAPKLKVEPSEINLGQVPMGSERQFELHLNNQGMRLVYGSVVSDSKWLTLGESPGSAQKLFQFGGTATIPVHIRGQHLRAGNKPLEGHLTIESNGGNITVLIRAEVPVKPFTEGVLAGAISPRQVAEKALKLPKEAAPWFEQGAIAKWFTSNGWIYPVQGPSASGMGAVQQFFEALGLTKPPKVEVTTASLSLRGAPGASLQAAIEVKTPEKRPVYAHASCDQSWVDASRTKLNGRFATINVAIKSVPNRPGETLQAKIHVTGNGNQRFVVPLTLVVDGQNPFADLAAIEPASGDSAHLQPVSAGAPLELVEAVAVQTMADMPAPSLAARGPAAFVDLSPAPPVGGPALLVPQSTGVVARPGPSVLAPRQRSHGKPMWMHLLPLAVLFLALVGIIVRDLVKKPSGPVTEHQDADLRIGLYFDFSNSAEEVKKHKLGQTMKFGMVKVDDPQNPKEYKRLTYDYRGGTNSTLVRIDNSNRIFAHTTTGDWQTRPFVPRKVRGMSAPWMFHENVLVTQTVQIIEGEPIELGPGIYKSMLDTCLIQYRIENKDKKKSHKVGLRFLLDTLIGENDGPTFTVPGVTGLVDTQMDFVSPKIPDFIQALEKPNIKDPGIIAQISFRKGGKLELPSRVSLTHWPGDKEKSIDKLYDVPMRNIGENGDDSAVVIYWKDEDMAPGKVRNLGFTFGLGTVTSADGLIGLSVGGSFAPGGELTVVALIHEAKPNQTVTLKMDPKFTLLPGSDETQKVPAGQKGPDGRLRPSPVTWRVRSSSAGTFMFEVESGNSRQKQRVTIKASTLF